MKTLFSILFLFSLPTVLVLAQDKDANVLPPKEFKTKMESTPGAVILDVRTPEEVNDGKLKGAVNVDFNNTDFEKEVAKLDKEKTYFVYCAKGGRSSKAYALLKSAGFQNVYDMEGGYDAWEDEGLPTVKK